MFARQLPARSPVSASALLDMARHTLPLGPDPRDTLRNALIERYAADGCALVASGSHALQLALESIRMRDDRPVMLPAYTCYEVATAAIGARVLVKLYDVDAVTLEPDWDSVRAAAAGAAALVVAPLYGMPLDWGKARRVADECGLRLVADVAQAHGTTWQQRPAGADADYTILSFGRGKGWTGAGGGALLWRGVPKQNAPSHASNGGGVLAEGKTVAKAGSQWLLGRRSTYGIPAAIPFLKLGETIFHEPSDPAGMARASAALLLASEPLARSEVLHRRRNAQWYAQRTVLSDVIRAVPGAAMNEESGALRFPLRVRGGWTRLRSGRAPILGVAASYPATLAELPALQPLVLNPQSDFHGAKLLAQEIVTLPTHARMTEVEMARVIEIVSE